MRLVFCQHAVQRMFERGITVDDAAAVLAGGRVIENYPNDNPYRSALWLGFVGGRPLHNVAAYNPDTGDRIVVTVYEPDPAQWASDCATRREP